MERSSTSLAKRIDGQRLSTFEGSNESNPNNKSGDKLRPKSALASSGFGKPKRSSQTKQTIDNKIKNQNKTSGKSSNLLSSFRKEPHIKIAQFYDLDSNPRGSQPNVFFKRMTINMNYDSTGSSPEVTRPASGFRINKEKKITTARAQPP